MKVINDLLNRVTSYNKALLSGMIIENIVRDNEAYIVDMNAQEQLYEQGVNALGVSIADYAPYSPITIQIKRLKGQPNNRVTLRDEGDFESSFFLVIDNKQFEIKAADWKTEELVKKYGWEILGLTRQSVSKLIWEVIFPDLLEQTKKMIYGK